MGVDLHFQTNGKAASPPEPAGERVVILSPREKLLLRRFANGKSDKVIAEEIGGTQRRTVLPGETHGGQAPATRRRT
jgi:DNA-binding NarL/FixJ family response regulator